MSTERITVPNREEKTPDGKPVYTPKQWLDRFKQFSKRAHKIDITPLIKGEDITETSWATKEKQIQEDFIWGLGPEATYQITRAEYKRDPDTIAIKELIRLYLEYYIPKRNTYHNRGDFFWAKQQETETPEDFWRRLIEIEKECEFETITAEEILISKYMTAITDKKLREKLMKEKKPEMKKTIELIKQDTYEKKNKKSTIPDALITTKEKAIKEEPIQRMERKFINRPKPNTQPGKQCRFCGSPNWNPTHNCPAKEANCRNCEKKGHYAKVCRLPRRNKRMNEFTKKQKTSKTKLRIFP